VTPKRPRNLMLQKPAAALLNIPNMTKSFQQPKKGGSLPSTPKSPLSKCPFPSRKIHSDSDTGAKTLVRIRHSSAGEFNESEWDICFNLACFWDILNCIKITPILWDFMYPVIVVMHFLFMYCSKLFNCEFHSFKFYFWDWIGHFLSDYERKTAKNMNLGRKKRLLIGTSLFVILLIL